jgi:GMP synthase (glutamine-hydrolysing)
MKKLIIIKAGSTFLETKKKLGDFEDWIIDGTGLSCEDVSVINAMAIDCSPT